jgi:hypothetical protein
MWISIVEKIYNVVEGWMMKEILATGNQEFIAKWQTVFKTIEGLWAEMKTIVPPVTPPPTT